MGHATRTRWGQNSERHFGCHLFDRPCHRERIGASVKRDSASSRSSTRSVILKERITSPSMVVTRRNTMPVSGRRCGVPAGLSVRRRGHRSPL